MCAQKSEIGYEVIAPYNKKWNSWDPCKGSVGEVWFKRGLLIGVAVWVYYIINVAVVFAHPENTSAIKVEIKLIIFEFK